MKEFLEGFWTALPRVGRDLLEPLLHWQFWFTVLMATGICLWAELKQRRNEPDHRLTEDEDE